MVKGVKGARRRLGSGASRRSGGASGQNAKMSNKEKRHKVLKAEGRVHTTRTELDEKTKEAIVQANPGDARSLLNLLVKPTKDGRVGFKGKKIKNNKRKREEEDIDEDEDAGAKDAANEPEQEEEEVKVAEPYKMWEDMGVDPKLLAVLKEKKFQQPTPVQEKTLSTALGWKKDIVAAAETGSGKTLAFGLPVIQRIMKQEPVPWEHRVIDCLIITPTRELAMQVHNHLKPFVEAAGLSSACVVGGMSDEKQLRLLNKSKNQRPHILIATPGRLWGLLEDNASDYLERSITTGLKYLVVDEADKMVQDKHFEEMGAILECIREKPPPMIKKGSATSQNTQDPTVRGKAIVNNEGWKNKEGYETQVFQEFNNIEEFLKVWKKENQSGPYSSTHLEGVNFAEAAKELLGNDNAEEEAEEEEEMLEEEMEEMPEMEEMEEMLEEEMPEEEVEEENEEETPEEGEEEEEEGYDIPVPDRLRMFITSATLMLAAKFHEGGKKIAAKQKREGNAEDDMLGEITNAFGLDRKKSFFANVTSGSMMVESLQEAAMHCLENEKELGLYHFLMHNEGRTLIFVNAISTLRRLVSILGLLGVQVYALHSEMQQRQRLKNLDRLKANEKCVVIATDVAARGLDIKGIEYVLHYQFPRNTDTYVHRCGRTARCKENGFSLALICPEEKQLYKKTCTSLGKEQGLKNYDIDINEATALRDRLAKAKQLDKALNKSSKVHVHNTWLEKNAKDMGLILDTSLRDTSLDDERKAVNHSNNINRLRHELSALLSQPLTKAKGSFRHSATGIATEEVKEAMKEKTQEMVKGPAAERKKKIKKQKTATGVATEEIKEAVKEKTQEVVKSPAAEKKRKIKKQKKH
eukprot:TRINITY_DN12386_c0_g1_i1.p1 TRINITY_DN12386_c0_g1~~TRINITY_DN12386_c0_g1_i1.p1  ORF type:complete len:879 (+),score=345.02 TRINITY_DN12386_c0_g1_i1:47-2638(+)